MLSTLECEGGVIVLNDKYNMLIETILDVLHYVSYLTHRSESGATRVPILITCQLTLSPRENKRLFYTFCVALFLQIKRVVQPVRGLSHGDCAFTD